MKKDETVKSLDNTLAYQSLEKRTYLVKMDDSDAQTAVCSHPLARVPFGANRKVASTLEV